MVHAAAADAGAVVGHVVLRRPRRRARACAAARPAPLEGRVLFLDTRPLHAVLMQNVIMLEQKIKGQPLSERTPRRSEQLGLVDQARVAGRPGVQAVRAPRRAHGRRRAPSTRSSASPRSPRSCARRSATRFRCSSRQELRRHDGARGVRAHAQRDATAASSMARRRLAAFAAPGGPWEVKDVSADRLPPARADERRQCRHAGHAGGDPPARPDAVDAGHRPPDEAADHRPRRDRTAGDRQHAGRRRPGRAAQARATPTTRSTASTTTINGRTFQGLFLALRKRDGEPPVQSLIVPAVEYQPPSASSCMTAKSIAPDPLGRLLEQQPDWVWTVDRAARRPTCRRRRRAGTPPADATASRMAVDRYAEIHAAHRWDVPAHFNIAHACCGRWAERPRALRAVLGRRVRRDRRATRSGTCSSRPTACPTRSRRWACARGDKVALILPQRPETVVAHIAVYQMGAVAVPLSFLFGPDALEYRLARFRGARSRSSTRSRCRTSRRSATAARASRTSIGVAGAREAWITPYETLLDAGVAALHAGRDARRAIPALLIYTSGTTGPPKGALMPQRACSATCPASSIRTTAFRARATCSGRRPTGRGPAG